MLPVVLAIITGDDSGYCNISVTEVAFKKGQSNVINLFSEYLEEQKILTERKEEVAEASTDIMSDI
jgi:predicted nucleotide-binding protein